MKPSNHSKHSRDRRNFSLATASLLGLPLLAAWQQAQALSIADLTDQEASQGLRAALSQGAQVAVGLLGQSGGFLNNEKVRIGLPGGLDSAAKLMRKLGQGQKVDELITSMNRAAEAAVPMAKDLLTNAVKNMSVQDAKGILTGGDTSVTDFFSAKTREPLSVQFLPVVSKAVEKVGLVEQYNQVAGKASGLSLMKKEDANIQQYVTGKTLDGLYLTIGEQERKLRQDPAGAASAIVKKVFGAI